MTRLEQELCREQEKWAAVKDRAWSAEMAGNVSMQRFPLRTHASWSNSSPSAGY